MASLPDLPSSLHCDFFADCGRAYVSNCDDCEICCCEEHQSRHHPGCPQFASGPDSKPDATSQDPDHQRLAKASSKSLPDKNKKRKLKQTTLTSFAVRVTKEDIANQHEQAHARLSAAQQERKEKAAATKLRKEAAKKERARLRQIKCRQLKKQREIESGIRGLDGKINAKKRRLDDVLQDHSDSAVGKIVEEKAFKTKRTNWFAPHLIYLIDRELNKWSSLDRMVNALKRTYPGLFNTFHKSFVSKWTDKEDGKLKWKPAALLKVKASKTYLTSAKVGRKDILAPYPAVKNELVTALLNLRAAGTPINSSIIRPFVLGLLQARCPQIFDVPVGNKSAPFVASRQWIRAFVAEKPLNWSFRVGTTASHKLPLDWQEQAINFVRHCAKIVTLNRIPATQVVNWDQTGVSYTPVGNQRTYETRNSRDVSIIGKEEKRACTATLTSALSGDVTPVQVVFPGKTKRALPSIDSETVLPVPSGKAGNHWANFDTLKDYVTTVLARYLVKACEKSGVKHTLLIFDCWSVHRTDEFRTFLKQHLADLGITAHIRFVPAHLTGKCQPADATLQRVYKHAAKQAWCQVFADIVKKEIDNGADPKTLKLEEGVDVVRDRLARCMVKAFDSINDPEIVKAAWRACKVGEYSLGSICDMEFGLRCIRELDEIERSVGGAGAGEDEDKDKDEDEDEDVGSMETAFGSWDDGDEVTVDELKQALMGGECANGGEDGGELLATVFESPDTDLPSRERIKLNQPMVRINVPGSVLDPDLDSDDENACWSGDDIDSSVQLHIGTKAVQQ